MMMWHDMPARQQEVFANLYFSQHLLRSMATSLISATPCIARAVRPLAACRAAFRKGALRSPPSCGVQMELECFPPLYNTFACRAELVAEFSIHAALHCLDRHMRCSMLVPGYQSTGDVSHFRGALRYPHQAIQFYVYLAL